MDFTTFYVFRESSISSTLYSCIKNIIDLMFSLYNYFAKEPQGYRFDTVNSNTVNSNFDLNGSFNFFVVDIGCLL